MYKLSLTLVHKGTLIFSQFSSHPSYHSTIPLAPKAEVMSVAPMDREGIISDLRGAHFQRLRPLLTLHVGMQQEPLEKLEQHRQKGDRAGLRATALHSDGSSRPKRVTHIQLRSSVQVGQSCPCPQSSYGVMVKMRAREKQLPQLLQLQISSTLCLSPSLPSLPLLLGQIPTGSIW